MVQPKKGNTRPTVILASSSPRRRELLKGMGVDFTVISPEVDERAEGEPGQVALLLAQRKARAVCALHPSELVVAADTLVSVDGQALGKPRDAGEARRMLHLLSGRAHDVFTGVCLACRLHQYEEARAVRTVVRFRALSEEEIFRYVQSGDPMDKAGAYGIQSGAAGFVESITGSYENVIGLPVQALDEMLQNYVRADHT